MSGHAEAPKPGLIPLRPMALGDIVGGAFRLFVRNPRTTLGTALLFNLAAVALALVVVVAAVTLGIAVFVSVPAADRLSLIPGVIVLGAFLFVMILAVSLVLQAILPALYIVETSHQVVGEKMRLGGLLAQVRGRIGALIGWLLLLFAAGLVVFLVIAGIVTALSALGGRVGIVIGVIVFVVGFAAFFVAAIVVGVKLALVPSVLVLERVTIRRAIARSWRLTRLNFWRVFGMIALVAIMVSVATNLVSAPVSIVSQLVGGPIFQPSIAPNGTVTGPGASFEASRIVPFVLFALLGNLVTLIITAIGTIVQSATTALLYIDLRIRWERLDLELLRYVHLRDAGVRPLPDPYRPPDRAPGVS